MTPLAAKIIWFLGCVAWFIIRYPHQRRSRKTPISQRAQGSRDRVLLANAGHFSELDVPALGPGRRLTDQVTEHDVGGKRVRLLGRGEMLNLTAATGNQIQVMDQGFALQAHSLRALAADPAQFVAGPQPVPAEIDEVVARAMLASLSASR